MNKHKIVISVETLLSGGAELFAIRLANSLCSQFEVYLVVVRGDLVDQGVAKKLKRDVHLVKIDFYFEWFVQKLDSFLLRLGIDWSIRGKLTVSRVRGFLIREKIKIIHTNQFKVDFVFCVANKSQHIPHIITVHGDYINFSERSKQKTLRILHFDKKAKWILQTVNKIVYISDHQRDFIISDLGLSDIVNKSVKIYNGVEIGDPACVAVNTEFKRKEFVFGMVARGIREKGWEEAIKAFLRIYVPGLQLVLVGQSAYLDGLKDAYPERDIYFVGYAENPTEWIGLFDVGLLPSTFASESLPTSVIEYIIMGKPVIATDKGEISKMLEKEGERCGIVLTIRDNHIVENELATAMELLWRNKDLYKKMASQTRKCAAYFDMRICTEAYRSVYHSLLKPQS